MTQNEKMRLFEEAKSAYYEGNPIMGDSEFDALEKELGLENKSSIGTHSESYTVRHPFTMGSLAKIQVKEDDGKTWDDYVSEIRKRIPRGTPIEATPKYDGCSFEVVADEFLNVVSVSTRGDGTWGKDIYSHIRPQVDSFMDRVRSKVYLPENVSGVVLRGEVLVSKADFESSLSDSYVNTRAFVAGSLNNDDLQETDKFLCLMFYDFRYASGEHIDPKTFSDLDEAKVPTVQTHILSGDDFEELYEKFESIRKSCEFPLDGFVLKPVVGVRSTAFDERPKDCVAIKFKPEVVATELVGVEWRLSPKTAEYFPVGIISPVILDSKTVTRVSLHNWGYVRDNSLGKGTTVRISMAGDIIPFLYEVLEPSEEIFEAPEDTYVSGVHLYKNQTESEKSLSKFLASADVLNIPGIGPKHARKLWDLDPVDHVLLFDFEKYAQSRTKTSENALSAVRKFVSSMSLAQLIESLAIPMCGTRMSDQCALVLLGEGSLEGFLSMASAGYSWVFDDKSPENLRLAFLRYFLKERYGKEFTAPKKSEGTVKAVLTGSPKGFGWATKAEFLKAHPELEEVSNLKDADVLITDDLSSTSSKMKKAEKLGTAIKTYGQI